MVNYNLYRVFYYVAKEKKISKASELLYISQPAVSFSIKELETQLNQKLFIRKSKGVELTSYGKILYSKLEPIINNLDDIENSAKLYDKLEKGILRIGCSSSNVNQILLEYLQEFVNKYSDIEIVMVRDSNDNLLDKLEKYDLDMIFVDKGKKNEDYTKIKQFDIEYKLIGNKSYKDKYYQDEISLKKFPVSELMVPSINNNSRLTINEFFAKEGLKLSPKYELDNYIMLYEFVKKGFGLAFVNIDYYKDKIDNKEVELIFPKLSIRARTIECLVNDGSNKALDKFINIINSK